MSRLRRSDERIRPRGQAKTESSSYVTRRGAGPSAGAGGRSLRAAEEPDMDAVELRALQAPIKGRYKDDPKAAIITLKARGTLDDTHIACKVETGRALA